MILLTGITGTCGRAILTVLGERQIPVRALVRDLDKVTDLSMPGLEIVQGDLEDESSIESALQGVDRAFLVMANSEQQLANEKRFIDVAKRREVSHLVKLSASGADVKSSALLKRVHGEAEEYLARSGMNYTHIRPNFFMQNILHCAASIVAEDRFYLPLGEGRTGIIDVADVADVVVTVLTESGHKGQTYYITGPEILSFYDLAEQMSEVLGRKITYVDLPAQEFRSQLLNWGSSDWYVNAVMALFELMAQDTAASVTDTCRELCGRAPRSFRSFVQQHRDIFGERERVKTVAG